MTSDDYGSPGDSVLISYIDEPSEWEIDTKPWLCEKCGNPVAGDGSIDTPCRENNCMEIRCRQCGFHWAGFGPVGCHCQNRDPKIRRIRQLYRSRRR